MDERKFSNRAEKKKFFVSEQGKTRLHPEHGPLKDAPNHGQRQGQGKKQFHEKDRQQKQQPRQAPLPAQARQRDRRERDIAPPPRYA